jgi:spore coat polysaccharide biosynthesis protein SpsF
MVVGQYSKSKMKTGIIIQARMGSERLPGKVLREIGGKSILEILINRIKNCGLSIIVATTTNIKDDILVEKLKSLNLPYYRGSEEDVLTRYYQCALEHKLDTVMRLTADNPFVNDVLINEVYTAYLNENNENLYVYTEKYPIGVGLEIFSFSTLKEAFINAKDAKEREHVTPYIMNCKNVTKKILNYKENKENYRLTIDTEADFKLAEELIIKYNAETLNIDELVNILDANPKLAEINLGVKQKEWND